MQKTIVSFIIPLAFFYFSCYGQTGEIITSFKKEYPKGTLFIIGGGDRDSNLMQELIEVSNYKPGDIIAVVTMASGWGDSAYIWLNDEFKALGKTNKNCIKVDSITVKNPVTLDSLLMAKIIFLSGGDQSVLMKHISGTEFKKKIQKAFWNGSTIAGTSAGAALMSEKMITGNALLDTTYESTFYLLLENNVEITEGLGLLDSVIIDQHFVVRSRYNRLLSALHAFPNYQCIGIDEETALVVHKGRGKVIGNSQVIVVSNTEAASDKNSIINTKNIDLDIYAPGEEMEVK